MEDCTAALQHNAVLRWCSGSGRVASRRHAEQKSSASIRSKRGHLKPMGPRTGLATGPVHRRGTGTGAAGRIRLLNDSGGELRPACSACASPRTVFQLAVRAQSTSHQACTAPTHGHGSALHCGRPTAILPRPLLSSGPGQASSPAGTGSGEAVPVWPRRGGCLALPLPGLQQDALP
jgi:hypothetical protein